MTLASLESAAKVQEIGTVTTKLEAAVAKISNTEVAKVAQDAYRSFSDLHAAMKSALESNGDVNVLSQASGVTLALGAASAAATAKCGTK